VSADGFTWIVGLGCELKTPKTRTQKSDGKTSPVHLRYKQLYYRPEIDGERDPQFTANPSFAVATCPALHASRVIFVLEVDRAPSMLNGPFTRQCSMLSPSARPYDCGKATNQPSPGHNSQWEPPARQSSLPADKQLQKQCRRITSLLLPSPAPPLLLSHYSWPLGAQITIFHRRCMQSLSAKPCLPALGLVSMRPLKLSPVLVLSICTKGGRISSHRKPSSDHAQRWT